MGFQVKYLKNDTRGEAMRLTERGIRLIREAFEEAQINPYGCGYNLFCITSYIEDQIPSQKSQDASRIGTTSEVQWCVDRMIQLKLL